MKARYIIYCALIALAVFSASASADSDIAIVGDANSDGSITTADSMLALRMAVGGMAPDIARADVNYDGDVNSLDALMILKMAQESPKTRVCVDAPEVVSGAFDVTIEICNVINLDSGQFDLWFDSGVVNVIGVDSGSIGSTVIPVGNWAVMHGTDNWDCDKFVRIIFDIPEVTGVSGSGSLATIHFEVIGTAGDASVLDISDGLLANTESDEILMLWNDCEVTVGTPVIVNAPETVSGTFDVTIDVANVTNLDSGQFDLSFNASVVNVTSVDSGVIGATEVRLDGWTFRDSDTVRVIFNLPGATGVSGSGHLATIHFEVTGTAGDASVLDISDGLLVDTGSGKILAAWIDDGVDV